ncbi:unnamed protein product [Musa hybrid cultivar]
MQWLHRDQSNGYPNNTEQLLTKLARSDISCSDRNKQSSTTSHMQKLFFPHVISTEGRTEQNLIHWSVLCFSIAADSVSSTVSTRNN